MRNKTSDQLDRATIFRVAALSGADPRTVAKHMTNPGAPIDPRGRGVEKRTAVLAAARELGVRR
jgi:hypothetical protein